MSKIKITKEDFTHVLSDLLNNPNKLSNLIFTIME